MTIVRSVTCPGCQCVTDVDGDAKVFCHVCDYPLFWAPSATVVYASSDGPGWAESLSRLPGVGGEEAQAFMACPYPDCGELNKIEVSQCLRCGRPIPIPPPPPEVQPPPPMPVIPDPEPQPARVLWPWILVLVLLVVIAVTAVAIWVT